MPATVKPMSALHPPLLKSPASLTNGTMLDPFPAPVPPAPVVPVTPGLEGPAIVVLPVIGPVTILPLMVPGIAGKETGCAVGVIVVEPRTILGTDAEFSGTAVPVRVAVRVVEDMTSVRVITLAGRAVEVGFVV